MVGRVRTLSRGQLVRSAAAVALGASIAPRPARATVGPLSDADLAWARIGVAAELLAIEFYGRLAQAHLVVRAEERSAVAQAVANEKAHYSTVSQILTGAGQTPAQADDFDYTFPAGAFKSLGAAARLGETLETAFLGIYLGGVAGLADPDLKTVFARTAASEAQHLTIFSGLARGKPIGPPFPAPLGVDDASAALDPYLS
jgi:demethoxyubiquinone hydroxylase (CLK1/Coq7/Cat5 family)